MESYFETYSEEVSKETSDEFQFVLALTGTITNMAAAAQGRDFLMSKDSGRGLIDSFVTVLTSSTLGKNVKLRNLILMALYNIRWGMPKFPSKGRLSNRTGTSVDDGDQASSGLQMLLNWIDQWQSGKLGTGKSSSVISTRFPVVDWSSHSVAKLA